MTDRPLHLLNDPGACGAAEARDVEHFLISVVESGNKADGQTLSRSVHVCECVSIVCQKVTHTA